jgi:transglutaminase-like putative cysteine protease
MQMDMVKFLSPTPVIDCDTVELMSAAAEFGGNSDDDELVARRCFFWVRDTVRHSMNSGIPVVTCTASEVLRHRAGFCFAKSHLLAAFLRARGIPAALCYQRLAFDGANGGYCLHGLVAVHLRRHGWYRVDPRGEKPGVTTDFCPPLERLAFTPRLPGEMDLDGLYADALPSVVAVLRRYATAVEVARHLPDCQL